MYPNTHNTISCSEQASRKTHYSHSKAERSFSFLDSPISLHWWEGNVMNQTPISKIFFQSAAFDFCLRFLCIANHIDVCTYLQRDWGNANLPCGRKKKIRKYLVTSTVLKQWTYTILWSLEFVLSSKWTHLEDVKQASETIWYTFFKGFFSYTGMKHKLEYLYLILKYSINTVNHVFRLTTYAWDSNCGIIICDVFPLFQQMTQPPLSEASSLALDMGKEHNKWSTSLRNTTTFLTQFVLLYLLPIDG